MLDGLLMDKKQHSWDKFAEKVIGLYKTMQ
jgi:hypothetical protein